MIAILCSDGHVFCSTPAPLATVSSTHTDYVDVGLLGRYLFTVINCNCVTCHSDLIFFCFLGDWRRKTVKLSLFFPAFRKSMMRVFARPSYYAHSWTPWKTLHKTAGNVCMRCWRSPSVACDQCDHLICCSGCCSSGILLGHRPYVRQVVCKVTFLARGP